MMTSNPSSSFSSFPNLSPNHRRASPNAKRTLESSRHESASLPSKSRQSDHSGGRSLHDWTHSSSSMSTITTSSTVLCFNVSRNVALLSRVPTIATRLGWTCAIIAGWTSASPCAMSSSSCGLLRWTVASEKRTFVCPRCSCIIASGIILEEHSRTTARFARTVTRATRNVVPIENANAAANTRANAKERGVSSMMNRPACVAVPIIVPRPPFDSTNGDGGGDGRATVPSSSSSLGEHDLVASSVELDAGRAPYIPLDRRLKAGGHIFRLEN
mmetsp:Transcript_18307/g.44089  ORF Transcript_18307/g.44089 Transcript_18307/m.44089 type:complete len:272 (+) Transcript_18307:1406-2221(+)